MPFHDSSPEIAVEYPPSSSLAGTTKSVDLHPVVHAHTSRSPPVELVIQHAYNGLVQRDNKTTLRKAKRTRLMLDVRTELTDEELKVSASNPIYLL